MRSRVQIFYPKNRSYNTFIKKRKKGVKKKLRPSFCYYFVENSCVGWQWHVHFLASPLFSLDPHVCLFLKGFEAQWAGLLSSLIFKTHISFHGVPTTKVFTHFKLQLNQILFAIISQQN